MLGSGRFAPPSDHYERESRRDGHHLTARQSFDDPDALGQPGATGQEELRLLTADRHDRHAGVDGRAHVAGAAIEVDDLLHATAAALKDVEAETSPEQALLIATTEAVTAIIDGRGVITRERLLAMAEVVTANSNLRKQASLACKRVLSQALAVRMGVAAENRRVRQAMTMWSAIAAGAYLAGRSMADHYDPRDDDRLIERMIAELTATFADVMGNDPSGSGGGAA